MSPLRSIGELPPTADTHFRLHFFAAILELRRRLPDPDEGNGLLFLGGYYDELDAAGFASAADGELYRWWEQIRAWERGVDRHLPLRALREGFELDELAMTLLVTAGSIDEDARVGGLFEALHGVAGEPRPTLGLLSTWTADDAASAAARRLLDAGLIETPDPLAARSRWALQVPPLLWEAIRGRSIGAGAPWLRHRAADELTRLEDLVLDEQLGVAVLRAVALLDAHEPRPLVVRGPRASGRHTLVGALARTLGLGLLEVGDAQAEPRLAGPLATALQALPVYQLEPAPGETLDLPELSPYRGPLAVVAGRRGGVRAERAMTLTLQIPDPPTRAASWAALLGDGPLARGLGASMRVTSGTIRRLGEMAYAEAALAGRLEPELADIRSAQRTLQTGTLDALATPIPAGEGWDTLAVAPDTALELSLLESRCRQRERLQQIGGPALRHQLTPGVRALFSGPSGTGKTLAARLLAGALGKELFAVDLATVVNKYLGETEKNLDAVFTRAEELDVILLLDEGDALMARRTDVSTSNDRYANLETNFLLTRLESYEGILVATSNASERIDPAFRRRLDVVVDFRAPSAEERWAIWTLHLPSDHRVNPQFMQELAARCELSGAQIRNAVIHAALLSLDVEGTIDTADVDVAVRREYAKIGAVCPLRGGALTHAQ
jgi:hypothetical protein